MKNNFDLPRHLCDALRKANDNAKRDIYGLLKTEAIQRCRWYLNERLTFVQVDKKTTPS